jgi:hypothetical protein
MRSQAGALPRLDDRRTRLRAAATARAAVSSPHLLAARIGKGPDGDMRLQLEPLSGPTLARVMRRGPLGPKTAVTILVGLARAVDALEGRRLVARDLAPDHVLLDRKRGAVLAESGLPTELVPLGRPDPDPKAFYRAPEEAGGRLTPRSSVYSLGAILLASLTGEAQPERLDARAGGRRREIPAPLAAVIERAMAPDPRERYANVAELAKAATASIQAAEPRARPVAVPKQPRAKTPKQPRAQAPRQARAKTPKLSPAAKPADAKTPRLLSRLHTSPAETTPGTPATSPASGDKTAAKRAERARRAQEAAERKAAEKTERERRAKEAAERKAAARAEAAKKRAAERAERERQAQEAAELKAAEQAERESRAAEEAERKAAEKAERDRRAREAAERKKAEAAAKAAEKLAERERRAKATAERKAAEQAERELRAAEEAERKQAEAAKSAAGDADKRAERERREQETAERKAAEKAERDRREQEAAQQKAAEKVERDRLARQAAERKKAEAAAKAAEKLAERERKAALAAQRKQADAERKRVESARKKVESERKRAEVEQKKAEAERERAAAAERKRKRAADRKRERAGERKRQRGAGHKRALPRRARSERSPHGPGAKPQAQKAAPTPQQTTRRRRAVAVTVVGLLAAAAGAIALAPGGYTGARRAGQISNGDLSMRLPAGWEQIHPSTARFGSLSSVLAAKPSEGDGTVLLTGMVGEPGETTDALRSLAPNGTKPVPARLGRLDVTRYDNLKSGAGSRARAYMLNTTGPSVLIVCEADAGAGSTPLRACSRVASTLHLEHELPLSHASAKARRPAADKAIAELASERLAARKRIAKATIAEDQAHAARDLQVIYYEASRRVEATGLPGAGAERLVTALAAAGDSYGSLAAAIRDGDQVAYDDARTDVIAREATVWRELPSAESSAADQP